MTRDSESRVLRSHLKNLARKFDTRLTRRYALQVWTPEKKSYHQIFRESIGRLLRGLGLLPHPPKPPPPNPWLTELKHVEYSAAAKPLLICAVGINRDDLRVACKKIRNMQTKSPDWAPVLVTDVADFAYFSRLNWLVEYVPSLSAPANGYFEHKLRYLAWRYRDIPTLIIDAEIGDGVVLEDLLSD